MKRPLLLAAISLVGGIITAHTIDSYLITIMLIITLFSAALYMTQKLKINVVLLLVIVAVYSFGSFEYYCFKLINEGKYERFAGEKVIVRGFIIQEPEIKDIRVIYTIKTNEVILENVVNRVKGKILLTVLGEDNTPIYEYGQAIEVAGEITLPKNRRNPGGFDYKRYLMQSGISATMFVRSKNILAVSGKKKNYIIQLGNSIRNRIIKIIEQSLPIEQAGLLNGMLIGYRSGLSKEIQEAFNDSGLIHIMAVSGAQVTFLIIPVMFIFKRLNLGRKISNIIMIGILIVFLSVTGFQPSVSRAVIMASIVLICQIALREYDIYTSISIAAIILLIYNPFTLFNVGFQLSFIATISLVMLNKNIRDILECKYIPNMIINPLSMIISAQIGVLPITAYYFNKISVISILSNLLVTPLIQITSVLGYIMIIAGQFSVGLSKLIGYINNIFLSLILKITEICADLPYSTVTILNPGILVIILYYALIWLFFYYKPLDNFKTWKSYSLTSIVSVLLLFMLLMPAKRGMEVVFLDVGNGDSALVTTEGGMAVLIDGGGYYNTDEDKNIGDSIIVPFLLSNGIGKLDMVIATHGHEDHVQGLKPVLESFKVEAFIIPDVSSLDEFKDLLDICRERNIYVKKCSRGDVIRLDNNSKIEVLNPSGEFNPLTVSLNNSSLVLKLSHLDIDFLFTGDIEKEAEADILKTGFDLESEVLKVPHHGSSTSTTPAFLEKVKPAAAIISVGRNNFGHPSAEVIKRLNDFGIMTFRTDIHGAVTVKSNGKRIKIKRMIT
ncbi:MAG TPA: DNA internalization-related competence protein ComEC/Rec2 [Clostridiaceae bacterium]|nr:DNA internalization-related competence protein ComEC/Rec2 [Clostridiaceae bacterium]